jgi:hypothetical protein
MSSDLKKNEVREHRHVCYLKSAQRMLHIFLICENLKLWRFYSIVALLRYGWWTFGLVGIILAL